MKKLISIVLLGFISISAFSQVYIGGGVSALYSKTENNGNNFNISLSPEVGYLFGERWMVGGMFNLQSTLFSGSPSRSLGAILFGRYNVLPIKKFGLWLDFGASYATAENSSGKPYSISIYAKPMLTYRLLDHLYIRAILDFAGLNVAYTSNSNGTRNVTLRAIWDSNSVMLLNTLSIGAQYVF